jgi:predicted nucleic acid-binding protein
MKAEPAVVGWLNALTDRDLRLTTITRAEIRYGVARLPDGRRRRDLTRRADDVFATFADAILPFDSAAADRCGSLLAHRESIGRPMGMADAQIAAITLARRATLATGNVADFEHCELRIANPFAD